MTGAPIGDQKIGIGPGGAAAPGLARAPGRTRVSRKNLTFDRISFMVVFLGVPLAIYLIFVISPFAQSIYYSLTDWSGFTKTQNVVGLANYTRLLHDDIFLKAVRNNILLAVVLPVVTLVLAVALATMVTIGGSSRGEVRGLRGSSFYRVVSFFPYTIPAIVIGLMWGLIFDPSSGLVNGILTGIGLDGFESYPWLGDARTAMGATIFVMLWGFVGFYMVLFVAAIRGIPTEVFEAARLDGAGRFRTTVSITIPLLRDNVQTAYIYLGIFALDGFTYMAALNSGGGPQNSTLVMSQVLFRTAFTQGKFGLASAMGVVLAVMTLLFAAIVFVVNRATGGTDEKGGFS